MDLVGIGLICIAIALVALGIMSLWKRDVSTVEKLFERMMVHSEQMLGQVADLATEQGKSVLAFTSEGREYTVLLTRLREAEATIDMLREEARRRSGSATVRINEHEDAAEVVPPQRWSDSLDKPE